MKKILLTKPFLHKIMRISVAQCLFIALFNTIGFAHNSVGQEILNKKISLNFTEIELKKVFTTIEKQADVKFVYSSNSISANQKITINQLNVKLEKALDEILLKNGIDYEVLNNRIILKQKNYNKISNPNLGYLPIKTIMEDPIRGTVKDSKGELMPGVTVVVKGTKKGISTDQTGNFEIGANKGDVLIFSFIGYKNFEFTVADVQTVNITLEESASSLNEVVVVGSRFSKPRTDVDRPVAIDVINAKELQTSGQVDLGQTIHFVAPSFNAVKFGINDAAPFVDPATLRGLGPDQVLVLINNKRRHKVSFLSINDGVGKGQVGTDINVVPALSLKRVEVLRDGAAAVYGSDAIAGVINLELNDASEGGAVNIFTGIGNSTPQLDVSGKTTPETINDGLTYALNANFGLKLTSKGYINSTITYSHTDGYDRSGTFKSGSGFFVKDAAQDAILVAQNNIDLDRAILGSAENTTLGLFTNAGIQMNKNWKWYAFGGYTNKHVITNVFTRPPTNSKRNNLKIFPNGYNPIAPADLQDFSIVSGFKGKIGNNWNSDFSISQGQNQVDWNAENTINPSLGDASPTEFYIGQTKVTQTLINADFGKTFNNGNYPNFTLGTGTEFRYESFGLKAGDKASYEVGPLFKTKDVGSSGREGFSDKAAGKWNRTNVGVYLDGESDITKSFLLGAALRFENYSDFGSNISWKLNSRLKLAEPFAVRGSVSKGFRAPSVTQAYYSNYVNISFDNAGNSIINPIIPATSELAKLLGVNGLKQETSFDLSGGFTAKIGNNFTLTADVYQIDVDNRIMLSGNIDVSKIPAFVSAGFPQSANVFVNAIDTRTKGLEFVGSYNLNLGIKSKVNLNAAFSSMKTEITGNRKTDTGIEVADKTATLFITDGLPKNKFIASANFDLGKFGFMLRASRFGEVSDPLASLAVKPTDPNAVTYQVFPAKWLTDLSINFKPTKSMSILAGVNNLFDIYPDLLQVPQLVNEVVYSRRTNQFGTQGRFLNLTLNYNF